MRDPIFFAWTRSFWLGLFPALLTAIDVAFALFSDPAAGAPVSALIAWAVGFVFPSVAADQIAATMQALAPVYAIIIAQQRSGASRPYTADWKARR